ncbi:MAG: biotin/lipoyl-containing protein [Comamonas sp.]
MRSAAGIPHLPAQAVAEGREDVKVNVGDTVVKEQSLLTVESDKAPIEIPSSHAGVVRDILVRIGDKVSEGALIVKLECAESAAVPEPAPAPAVVTVAVTSMPAVAAPDCATVAAQPIASGATPAACAAVPVHHPTVAPSGQLPHVSLSVRKFARERGVSLEETSGTARKGRICQADVLAFTKQLLADYRRIVL